MASWWISPHQWGCFLPGAEIEGGLSFAARLEDRIREALNVQEEATEEITVQNADDAPLDLENDFDLQAQTEEQRAKQEAEIKAAAEAEAKTKRKADEAERKRKEQKADKARADETVDSFELGQSSEEAMSGMGDMFSQQPIEAQDGQQIDGTSTELKFSRAADTAEGQRQFKETERAYGGKDAYDRAKKAGKTKLNYQQWVQVRTPAFKEWFGDWEVASAKLERKAGNFTEARQAAKAFQGKPLTNRGTGIVATVSRNNLDKMLSQKSVGKSASPALHSAAVANLDSMFERAVLGWSKPDNEGDPNIKAIHRFFTPVMVDGKAMMAKMTVKETVDPNHANGIYTVESVSFEEKRSPAAQWVDAAANADGIDLTSTRSAGLVQSMVQSIQGFNPDSASKVTDPETGEPLVVYHGTNADITSFDINKLGSNSGNNGHFGAGHYFTSEQWEAEHYGTAIMPAFLNIKKPLTQQGFESDIAEQFGAEKEPLGIDKAWMSEEINKLDENAGLLASLLAEGHDFDSVWAEFEKRGGQYNKPGGIDLNLVIDAFDDHIVSAMDSMEEMLGKPVPQDKQEIGYRHSPRAEYLTNTGERGRQLTEAAKSHGYDGVVMGGEYVAFESNQIKSATGNVGTFRKDTDNITRSQRQQPKPTGSTVQGIRDSLRQAYGKLIDKLEASGKVKLVQGIDDAIDAAAKARAAITGQSVESIKQSLMASVQNQIAYHGTPYRGIEQTGFKLNKIGSGEGAQAYGWGIYFAGKKDVAELYRDALVRKYAYKDSPVVRAAGEQLWEMLHARSNRGDRAVISEGKYYFDARTKESFLNDWLTDPSITRMPEQKEAVEKVLTGQLYRAEVPEDSDLLDYDKPLSQQPKKVRDALLKLNDAAITNAMTTEPVSMDDGEYWSFMGNTYSTKREALEDYTPEKLVTGRLGNFKSPQAVAEAMQSVGIPGLRYLDGNSRTAGEGSHNYVIWDEALLTPEAAQIEPLYSSNGDVEGFYDPQAGQSYLIADALTEETAPGTLMHEVGIHMAADGAHMTELFGRAEQLLNQYPNNPFMRRVKKRMEEAGETSAEEAAAYIVTEYENNRALAPKSIGQFVKDMLAAIRGWMFRNGYGIKAGSLTAADIAAVARANARTISGGTGGHDVFFSKASITPWPVNFPRAIAHTSIAKVTSHPDYAAAKSGDLTAARKLVADTVKQERLKMLASNYEGAIVVPVREVEASGKNAIPYALAEAIAAHGMKIQNSKPIIIQTTTVKRKDLDAIQRLKARKTFDGLVVPGRQYIIVDDVLTQGGTVHELRTHIVNNGGEVAAVSALAFAAGSNIIAIQQGTIDSIVSRFGRERTERLLQEHNISGVIESLTESEGRAIARFKTFDALRNRLAQTDVRGVGGVNQEATPSHKVRVDSGQDNNIRRSFAGRSSKTANQHALSSAQQRIEAGENAEQVRQDTGWHIGNDGKWRYEISDDQAKMKKPYPEKGQLWGGVYESINQSKVQKGEGYGISLGEILDHPALFAAYPHLADLSVSTQKGRGASYERGTPSSPASISIGTDVPMYDVPSKLLHEIQHGIQFIEGFALGGSPFDESLSTAKELSNVINREYAAKAEIAKQSPEYKSFIAKKEGEYIGERYRIGRNGARIDAAKKAAEDAAYEKFLLPIDVERQARIDAVLLDTGLMGLESRHPAYRRLSGEIEARNTQSRQNMTAEQRKSTPPEATQDISDSEAIVIFNGQEMHSAPTPENIGGARLGGTAASKATGQQAQTDTAAFKRWFGDSKIVDRSGKPAVMYHGTMSDFGVFTSAPQSNGLIFVTDSTDVASRYATEGGGWTTMGMAENRANIKVFLDEHPNPSDKDVEAYAGELPYGVTSVATLRDFQATMAEGGNVMPLYVRAERPMGSKESPIEWSEAERMGAKEISSKGFDSVWVTEGDGVALAVLDSKQLKSATGNKGTFDLANPDIRFSRTGMVAPEDAETGKPMTVYYARNTISSKKFAPPPGMDFGQKIEPAGEYMVIQDSDMSDSNTDQWEYGAISFSNPLVLEHKSTGSTGWKKDLSEMFGGKTGKALSTAVKKAGYDGIVTRDKYGYSEAVNLAGEKIKKGDEEGPRFSRTGATGQQPQTETAAFERWFGDSKVVDENGEPLVMYHGSLSDFDTFKEGDSVGIHVGTAQAASDRIGPRRFSSFDKDGAEYKNKILPNLNRAGKAPSVMPLYVRAENPIRMKDTGFSSARSVLTNLKLEGSITREEEIEISTDFAEAYADIFLDGAGETPEKLREYELKARQILYAALEAKGYDSIVYSNDVEDRGSDSYILFRPAQVKSATGNSGDFNPGTGDIRYSRRRGKRIDNPNQLDLFSQLEEISNDDPYQKTKQRAGTTEKQRGLGRSALRDLFGWLKLHHVQERGNKHEGPTGGVSLLGASIYKDFQAGKPYQLIGQKIESPKDLAALAQVYRDPRFETFRAFYLDSKGKIILEQAASTRMPASVAFTNSFLPDLRSTFDNVKASSIYILHNHPSGVPTPSAPDINITQVIGREFGDKLAGHVVINHNSYAVIDRTGLSEEFTDESLAGIDFNSRPEKPHSALNQTITSPSHIGLIAKQSAHSDTPLVVVTKGGASGKVGLIATIPMKMLEQVKTNRLGFTAAVRRMIRAAGTGGKVFIVLPKSYGTASTGYTFKRGGMQWLHEFAQDVVDSDGNSVIDIQGNVSIDDYAGVRMKDGKRDGDKRAAMREEGGDYQSDIRFSRKKAQAAVDKLMSAAEVIDAHTNRKRAMPEGLTPAQQAAAGKFATFMPKTPLATSGSAAQQHSQPITRQTP